LESAHKLPGSPRHVATGVFLESSARAGGRPRSCTLSVHGKLAARGQTRTGNDSQPFAGDSLVDWPNVGPTHGHFERSLSPGEPVRSLAICKSATERALAPGAAASEQFLETNRKLPRSTQDGAPRCLKFPTAVAQDRRPIAEVTPLLSGRRRYSAALRRAVLKFSLRAARCLPNADGNRSVVSPRQLTRSRDPWA
jgi:hypothetical protein